MSLQAVLDRVPYVALTGVEVEDYAPGRVVLSLTPSDQVRNHVGSFHAGALFTLAETAASAACATHPALTGLRLLARGVDVRFKKPARAQVTAHAEITAEMAEAVLRGVELHGRYDLEVPVLLLDGHGEIVATVRGSYGFRPRD